MRLSICIPTYNRANYLDECLESIQKAVNKCDEDIQIIIADNNSPDHTGFVVKKYKKLIKNITYIRRPVTVFAEDNFYLLLQESTAKYFWLLGDDDKLSEDALICALQCLDENPDIAICNFSLYSKDFSREIKKHNYSEKKLQLADHNDMISNFGTYLGFISGAIVERSVFFNLPREDYDRYKEYGLSFFYTLCKCAINRNISYIEKPIVQCRTGNSGNYDWVKYMIIGYDVAFANLIENGYKVRAIDAAKKDFLIKEVFWYLMKIKADGEASKKAYIELNSRYRKFYEVRLLCNVLKIVPGSLFRKVRSIKRVLVKDK